MSYIESFGAIKSPKDVRDYIAQAAASIEYPEEFELQIPQIKNQGSVGSCVAHSLASIVEYFNIQQENTEVKMSVSYIYGNRLNSTYKGIGMIVRDAIDAVKSFGTCPENLFGGNYEVPSAITIFQNQAFQVSPSAYPNRITSYFSLRDIDSVKACLMSNGPVIMVTRWYPNSNVIDGIMVRDEGQTSTGSHCMYIYGWNKDGWKIANSWGTGWGNNGTMIFPYSYTIDELWGITDTHSETLRQKKIDELENKIFENMVEQENLLLKIEALEILFDKEENDKEKEEELLLQIIDAEKKYKKLEEELKEAIDKNEQLNKQMLEIKKPYSGTFGELAAAILNLILRLLKK